MEEQGATEDFTPTSPQSRTDPPPPPRRPAEVPETGVRPQRPLRSAPGPRTLGPEDMPLASPCDPPPAAPPPGVQPLGRPHAAPLRPLHGAGRCPRRPRAPRQGTHACSPESDNRHRQMRSVTPEAPARHPGSPGRTERPARPAAKSSAPRVVGGRFWRLSACQRPQASPDSIKLPGIIGASGPHNSLHSRFNLAASNSYLWR